MSPASDPFPYHSIKIIVFFQIRKKGSNDICAYLMGNTFNAIEEVQSVPTAHILLYEWSSHKRQKKKKLHNLKKKTERQETRERKRQTDKKKIKYRGLGVL